MSEEESRHRLLAGLAIAFGAAFAVMLIFSFGMFVGEQKARFHYGWGRNYGREFGGPPPPPLMFGRPRGSFGGHGAAGVVIKKEKSKLLLRSPDNAERVILIDKNTYFVQARERAALKDIKVNARVVVVGSPDAKGRIKAKLIRIFEPGDWKEPMWRKEELRLPAPSVL